MILDSFTNILVKKLFGNDIVNRFAYVSLTIYGIVPQGSLLERVVRSGQSPINLLINKPVNFNNVHSNVLDGHIDSLKMLLCHENFVKPYSDEHLLVHLLTTSM